MTKRTALYDLHARLGAKFTPFAGYDMPVQYPAGVLAEHKACREGAALFDVSHMGQIDVAGDGTALERVVSADVTGLKPGRQRYALLLAEDGGVLDDLMIARASDGALRVVANAATKANNLSVMQEAGVDAMLRDDLALLALQGPRARAALSALWPGAADMIFMDVADAVLAGVPARVTCSGYTGEDGYEISVPAEAAQSLAEALLAQEDVAPAGLAARDVLRLEAGLPLYGQDLDAAESPGLAGLAFAVSKKRREAGDLRGQARVMAELEGSVEKTRVALALDGRAAARTGAKIYDGDDLVGSVTSGAYSPELGHAIAIGFAKATYAGIGTELTIDVRGKRLPARVVALPFRPARYVRKKTV